ncbi:MAG TPA: methionyl-tRNA formyltransferase [Fimbriimonadaceae bacterium]|nr:methionyl-tRNA formyltransferase [Armatimonadota bacterium]HCM73199.1 methionyl-tRNA formyltransferase [Armatimonadota bacterium]HRD30822.1 methionyl-tRNA formyltransferase [Fimbriimonadaceae bacterium]HRE94794.1 methionyl-tRNA formyltransferase [Fimbriimonadaceae bacterium]HRI75148.1 methionyl-tRNA formyltransferase [Fimbriimonadaceae bacterium]
MKVVFFGTAPFAIPALEAVAGVTTLVVAQPDRPTGRGLKTAMTPVKARALELGLPVETPERCRRPEVIERLKRLDADLFVVAAYGQILPQALLDVPRYGCVNVHGSLLPAYRGAAPVQHAIWNGDAFSGVTLMRMDAGMDTGDIIAMETCAIAPDETAGELYDRLATLGGQLMTAHLATLGSGQYVATPQDHTKATMAPKILPSDAEIPADEPYDLAYRRFRAMTPVPGAWIQTVWGRLKLRDVRPVASSAPAGTVVGTRPEFVIALPGGALVLRQVQPEGKKAMRGTDFANGARIQPGNQWAPTP